MLTGQLICAARKSLDLSRRQLALTVPCDPSSITYWEDGRRIPLPSWLDRLAEVLNTAPEALKGSDYRVHKNHNRRAVRIMKPIQTLPEGHPQHEFQTMTEIIRMLRARFGKSVNAFRVHEFVQARGLPAYENALRKNRNGEPTLLFKRAEVLAWLETQIRPINPAIRS